MVCLECGRDLQSINYKHLRGCCGLTPAEYRVRHPGAALMTPEVRASCALALDKNPKWKGRTGRRCAVCGKTLYRRTKGTACAECRQRDGARNPFFGRHHSREVRLRMAALAKRRDRATYVYGHPSREALSAGRRRYWSTVPLEERSARLASFIAAGQRSNKRSSKTRIEQLVAGTLRELGVSFTQNQQIGRYNVDFRLGDGTVIECYGDFWHCNPAVYEPTFYNKSLHITAQEKWARDAARVRWLIKTTGCSVHIIWESDAECAPRLRAIVEGIVGGR